MFKNKIILPRKKSYATINSLVIKNEPKLATKLFEFTLLKDSSKLAQMIIYP